MSEKREAEVATPQPGAVRGEYVENGLPCEDVPNKDDPEWPVLPKVHAVNFVSVSPVPIALGVGQPAVALPLFRVWGEPAWDIGRYWTLTKPEGKDAQAKFYADAAVVYSWNSGRYIAELKSAGLITRIRAWQGPVARQPAAGIDESGRITTEPLPGYFLPGGITQVYIPDGTLPYLDDTHTPWNLTAPTGGPEIPRPSLLVALPPPGVPATAEHYAALAAHVTRLSRLLRSVSDEMAGLHLQSSFLIGQAHLLEAMILTLNTHLAYFPDTASVSRLKAIALGLVGIGRYVDGDFSWSARAADINEALDDVVRWAYALSHAPN